jgi:hypothetical protein
VQAVGQVGERWGKGLAAPLLFAEDPDPEAIQRWLGRLQIFVAGSGVEFENRGSAELKGVPREWRLYAVSATAGS